MKKEISKEFFVQWSHRTYDNIRREIVDSCVMRENNFLDFVTSFKNAEKYIYDSRKVIPTITKFIPLN